MRPSRPLSIRSLEAAPSYMADHYLQWHMSVATSLRYVLWFGFQSIRTNQLLICTAPQSYRSKNNTTPSNWLRRFGKLLYIRRRRAFDRIAMDFNENAYFNDMVRSDTRWVDPQDEDQKLLMPSTQYDGVLEYYTQITLYSCINS